MIFMKYDMNFMPLQATPTSYLGNNTKMTNAQTSEVGATLVPLNIGS